MVSVKWRTNEQYTVILITYLQMASFAVILDQVVTVKRTCCGMDEIFSALLQEGILSKHVMRDPIQGWIAKHANVEVCVP